MGRSPTAFALVLLGWSLGASEPSHVFIEREVIREVPAAPVSLVVHDIKIERMLFQQAWEAIDERRWQRAEALCDEAQRDYFLPTCTEIRALAAEGLGERERACTLFERAHSERAIQLQAFAAYTERARCAEWHIGPSGTLAQSILDEKVSKARQRMFKGDYQGALDLCEAIESISNCHSASRPSLTRGSDILAKPARVSQPRSCSAKPRTHPLSAPLRW